MKNPKIIVSLTNVCLLSLSLIVISCSASGRNEILKPQVLYRSPSLDFSKVKKCGVMPVNNIGSEIPEINELLTNGIFTELKLSQKAWEISSADEILREMNEAGLGRGYQNYIADLNTYANAAGATPVFTAETQKFFDDLKTKFGIEALLFTAYLYEEKQGYEDFLGYKISKQYGVLQVYTALYDITSKRTWWVAEMALQQSASDPKFQLVKGITQSFAQNFGKGTLRQL